MGHHLFEGIGVSISALRCKSSHSWYMTHPQMLPQLPYNPDTKGSDCDCHSRLRNAPIQKCTGGMTLKKMQTHLSEETLFCAEVHRGRSLHSMQRKAFSLQRFS